MVYHSTKIDEINKRVRELWSLIYRGKDIDRVELRAEKTSAAATASYNYRVVMRKNMTDLDMRGESACLPSEHANWSDSRERVDHHNRERE